MSNQYCNFCFEQDAIKKGQHCCDVHFEEIKNICHNKDFDCGLTWDYRCDSINTNKYAGLLQFEDGTYFEILPKISDDVESGRKIFKNLIFASHRLFKEIKEFQKDVSVSTFKNNYILEIYIAIFCKELEEILKRGISKSYISQEDNLFFLRGKLKLKEHILKNAITKNRFYVQHDEFSENIPRNRILKQACQFLLNKTKTQTNLKTIRKMLVELDNVSSSFNLAYDIQLYNKNQNRLNDYYSKAIKFAIFFLTKSSYLPQKGKNILPALLFPLNDMFEDYIENILKNDIGIKKKLKVQYQKHFLLNNDKVQQKMDFVIMDDNNALILDAKWKIFDCIEKIDVGDLRQLYTYSQIIRQKENIENVSVAIAFPKTKELQEIKETSYFDGTKLYILPIDVENTENEYFISNVKIILENSIK